MKKRFFAFLNDFKAFAMRGNVLDLAVGVIIGGAFGKITTSLVNDIIMPLIGLLIGGLNFKEWKYTLPDVWGLGEPATLNIGLFVQSVVDFSIIAFCVFLMIKLMTRLRKQEDENPAEPEPQPEPEPDEQTVLLREIRDILKKGKS